MILGGLLVIAVLINYFFIHEDFYSKRGKNKLKKCPNCSSDVEDSFNICPICKVTLIKKCLHCGNRIEILWNFCPECEKPIEKGEHK